VTGDLRADIALIEPLTGLASQAAAAILAVKAHATQLKADDSPVTLADHAAQEVILTGLTRLLPDIPVISEESAERALARGAPAFVLVDPLDGTRDFIAGRDEFTVNIALVRDGTPMLGVVAAPALGLIWRGLVGHGAERLRLAPGAAPHEARESVAIRTRPWPACAVATVSRSHLDPGTEAFVAQLGEVSALACGSSVKFCRIAEGSADLYPRLAPTSEWDLAAGHAVLAAAGGVVETPDGAPLVYGRRAPDFRIPAFVAWGDPQAPARR
jgi:3'(2'), 5'-bisphosphate nucleotidase